MAAGPDVRGVAVSQVVQRAYQNPRLIAEVTADWECWRSEKGFDLDGAHFD